MVDATPGYDFGVNEIPTAANLLRQATGLQISGIDVTALDSAVVGLKSGDISNVTDSLQVGETVGTMWAAPNGDWWVQEQSGPVVLNRIMGGWETRRMFVNIDPQAAAYINPGSAVQPNNQNGAYENTLRVEVDNSSYTGTPEWATSDAGSYENNRSGTLPGVLQETCTSDHARVCHRGITILRDRDATSSGTWSKMSDIQNNKRLKSPQGISNIPMFEANYFHVDIPSWKHFAWIGLPSPRASKVSDATFPTADNPQWKVEWVVWAWGHWMWVNEKN